MEETTMVLEEEDIRMDMDRAMRETHSQTTTITTVDGTMEDIRRITMMDDGTITETMNGGISLNRTDSLHVGITVEEAMDNGITVDTTRDRETRKNTSRTKDVPSGMTDMIGRMNTVGMTEEIPLETIDTERMKIIDRMVEGTVETATANGIIDKEDIKDHSAALLPKYSAMVVVETKEEEEEEEEEVEEDKGRIDSQKKSLLCRRMRTIGRTKEE